MHALATKLYKIKDGLLQEMFTETFAREAEFHYNLRQCKRDKIEVNAGRVQIRFSQTGFQVNDERLGGCFWQGNLISYRLESNWS